MSTPHLSAMLGNGTIITLPSAAWLNQTLVRSIFDAAGAPMRAEPLDDDDWLDVVFALHDAADHAQATA